jgi:hypothetical protein
MQTKLYEKQGKITKGPLTIGDLSEADIASLLSDLETLQEEKAIG